MFASHHIFNEANLSLLSGFECGFKYKYMGEGVEHQEKNNSTHIGGSMSASGLGLLTV